MDNYTNTSLPAEPLRYTTTEQIVIIIVMVVMSMAATLGNILTVVAYCKVKSLQRPTNYFILSLAAADFVVATFVVNFHTMYMVLDWPYTILNYDVCLLWLTVDYWVFQVSVFGVLLIAGDRYLSIKYPNGYREFRTRERVLYMIVGNWLLSFLIWVPLILVYGNNDNTRNEMIKLGKCDVGSEKQVPATVIGCLVSYVLPIFIIIALAVDSVRILMRLKKKFHHKKIAINNSNNNNTNNNNNNNNNNSNIINNNNNTTSSDKQPIATIHNSTETSSLQKANNKRMSQLKEEDIAAKGNNNNNSNNNNNNNNNVAVKGKKNRSSLFNPGLRLQSFSRSVDEYQWIATFNVLLGVTFIVNILPFGVLAVTRSVCHAVSGQSCVSQEWWYFGYIMCYLNSMLNPVCYAVGNKNFKKAFKQLLFRDSERRRSSAMSVNMNDSVHNLRHGVSRATSLDKLN